MRKKFNIFLVVIFALFPFQAKATMSHLCFDLFEKIKNSRNLDISSQQSYENSTFGFMPKSALDLVDDKEDWNYVRDKNNYPYVGKITSDKLVQKIRTGDKIISIDGNSLNKLKDKEIRDLLYFTENNTEIYSTILFERDDKQVSIDLKIINEYQHDDEVTFLVSNISEISQKKGTFKADVYLDIQTFYDYDTPSLPLGKLGIDTLIFKDQNGNWDYKPCKDIPEEKIVEYNIPDASSSLSLWNTTNVNKNSYIKYINIWPFSDRIDDPVETDYLSVQTVTTGAFEFKNNFDLKTFPFDRQKLKIEISHLGGLDKNLIDYNANTLIGIKNAAKNININGWEIVDHNITEKIYKDAVGKNLSGFEITFDIERKTGYYVYKVILPILLILMICWSAVWISPRELESKLTISIVCLLSLIAYNFVIDKELPKLEYLTVLDWIILVSYVYATIPNFLSILTFRFYKERKNLLNKKIDNYSKFLGPTSYLVIIFLIIIINVNLNPNHSGKLIAWMG